MMERLSNREVEVMQLTAGGLTAREVGLRLGLAGQSVKNIRATVREKVGAGNTTEAVSILMRSGVLR